MLQLLPDQDRRSSAGNTVEVWEGLDGELTVAHKGREIATREAPPRASVLRGSRGDDPYKDRTKFMRQVEACLPAAVKPAKKRGQCAETNPTDAGLLGGNPRGETQRSVASGDRQRTANLTQRSREVR